MNWSDFFSMGGYALYVWGSYGVTAALLVIEVMLVLHRRRSVMQRLTRITRLAAQVEQ